jgi:hypothetical protein
MLCGCRKGIANVAQRLRRDPRRRRTRLFARGGQCLQVNAATAVSRFEGRLFSGAVMNSYLEREFRPLRVLKALQTKLMPKAPLIIKVPNAGSLNAKIMGGNWCGVRLPDLGDYFSPEKPFANGAGCGGIVFAHPLV